MEFSGIFTKLAASIGRTRTRWDSNASEGKNGGRVASERHKRKIRHVSSLLF